MKKIVLLSIILFAFLVQGCRTRQYTVMTWDAAEYKYKFTEQDSIYLKAFKEQDSLQLAQNTTLEYLMSSDSLIIYEDPNIKKFYQDTFEVYEYLSDLDYNLYHYYYSGEIIRMYNYHGKDLNFERVNVDGTLHLRNLNIGNSF
jgi:isocitrate dehydrogenase